MFSAVVYSSCTGSCKKYAELVSESLNIPAFELGKAKLCAEGKVLYIGWLFAGKIKGCDKAFDLYNVGAVAQVGMGPVDNNSEKEGRKNNGIDASIPLFCLQGGLNMKKLPLLLRLLMIPVTKSIADKLSKKEELTEQEKATLKMAQTGEGEPASWDVSDVVAWCKAH